MSEEKENVRVGVGVMVIKERKVLMQRRKGSHGEGSGSFPGGHLEFNESIQECAQREVTEEVGLKIKNIKEVGFTEDIFSKEGKHYITIFIFSEYEYGEIKINEQELTETKWFDWNNLPKPLFIPVQNLIKKGFDLNRYIEVNREN